MMEIDTRALLKMMRIAGVTKAFVEREIDEPFIGNRQFVTLDAEQASKLLGMFTVNEVIDMLSYKCLGNMMATL